jgi:NAD(P)H dehydrogenase (quinone)
MKINIMAATSRLGQRIIDELLKSGVPSDRIIASVRDLKKAQFLADKGIALRLADYENKQTLLEAFKDTDVLLLIPTLAHVEDRIRQHYNAIQAAKQTQVQRVVFAGFMTASVDSKFAVAPFMLYAESKLRVSGLDWTIVRNGRYLEEVSMSVPEMLETGVWEVPINKGHIAYISRDDLARGIAVVCMDERHSHKTYTLTGLKAYGMEELTETIRKITGKSIEYRPISIEEWIQRSLEKGMEEEWAELIASLYRAIENGEFELVTNHVEELTGRRPESAESFICRMIE